MGSAQRGQACCAHLLVLFVLIVSNSGIVCMRRWMGASFPADDWKIRILVAHQQQLRAQVSAGVGDHTERQHGFVVASPSARRPSRGRQAVHLRRADATAVHRTKVRRTKSSPWRSEATAAATPCRQKTPSSKASFPNQDKSSHQSSCLLSRMSGRLETKPTLPRPKHVTLFVLSTHTRGSATGTAQFKLLHKQ